MPANGEWPSSVSQQKRSRRTEPQPKLTRSQRSQPPAPRKVNAFGKRSHGHVVAQAFPPSATLRLPAMKDILVEHGVPVKASDDRTHLRAKYKTLVDRSAFPTPKRSRLSGVSDESDEESDEAEANPPINRQPVNPRSDSSDLLASAHHSSSYHSSDELTIPQKRRPTTFHNSRPSGVIDLADDSDSDDIDDVRPLAHRFPARQEGSQGQHRHIVSNAHPSHPHSDASDLLALPANQSCGSDSSDELTAPQKRPSTTFNNARPSRLIDLADGSDSDDIDDVRSPVHQVSARQDSSRGQHSHVSGTRLHDSRYLREPDNDPESSISVEDQHSQDDIIIEQSPGPQVSTRLRRRNRIRLIDLSDDDGEDHMQSQHSIASPEPDDEIDELCDDLRLGDDTVMAGPETGRSSNDADSPSPTVDRLEEDREWAPMSEDDSDGSDHVHEQAPEEDATFRNPQEESSTDADIPDFDSMSTAALMREVKAYGIPCGVLSREQLLKLCKAMAQQTHGTRSGQAFRHGPENPTSSDDGNELPRESAATDEDSDGHRHVLGSQSCRAMHRRTAAEIEILKKNQQLTIAQIDEILQVVTELRDQSKAEQEPTRPHKSRLSQSPDAQTSDFRKLIRQHCAVLLGWTSGHKVFPAPANPGERSEWGQPITLPPERGLQLYPHETATSQQVHIIHRMMQQAGARRFAPNFLEAPNHANNQFLWTLAVDIFVELVDCGEYNVDETLNDPKIIGSEMRKYVRETLARRYKKENLWAQDRQNNHSATQKRRSRRLHLVERRLEVASHIEGLDCLYPVIQAACSEDETDYEEPPAKNRKRGRKHCVILRVPWRSEKLTEIFTRLDEIGESQKQPTSTKPSGPAPRVRRRDAHAAPGAVAEKPDLPEDCFRSKWLQKLSQDHHRSLRLGPPCGVKRIAQNMCHGSSMSSLE
ncbi:hypothetical protein PGT21_036100 [Puccinia graminis f. sp. tritici]|uniref:Uncharacterized protein n=1 Tax=Puccinia graminis f. sp. tritici TaxID=56615 RepID=A0A5B0PBN2_PUCGR|nr:hypothetical protein PGT21_036100 [Puccinia graminis f. sp. tritici]KAA1100350.1 hypothetical protein PGTUg99_021396 [Puccinia graminis f. sp. tritici]